MNITEHCPKNFYIEKQKLIPFRVHTADFENSLMYLLRSKCEFTEITKKKSPSKLARVDVEIDLQRLIFVSD